MFFRFKNKNKYKNEINPEDIFLDSSNLPHFDNQQFEGRLEKPISKKTIFGLEFFFILILVLFSIKLYFLQIKDGSYYLARGNQNRLKHSIIFPERGIIYDRNNKELVWNTLKKEGNDFAGREYTKNEGLYNLLGYVSYPLKDGSGNYYEKSLKGKDGIEKLFNKKLKGEDGLKIVEVNALMKTQSESVIKQPKNGENIKLTVDSELQSFVYKAMKELAQRIGFRGGAAIIMNVKNGNILDMTSYPEYNSNVMSNSEKKSSILKFIRNKDNPFLDRVSSGLYAPGSIIKPFVALGALTEKVIDPKKQILSTGSISIQNPYYPKLKTVFKDWRAQGWVDMRKALAVSSDVYFYEVGGGFKDQKGLGITRLDKYMHIFGFGSTTGAEVVKEKKGLVPSPEWKKKVFKGEDWYIGDTYHTAIGQYGFLVTLLQVVRAVASIANGGTLLTPVVTEGFKDRKPKKIGVISPESYEVVREGMRDAVLEGTAKGLNVDFVKIAAKTGTAELGVSKSRVNAWVIGFFPYKKPKYAFAFMMESGPAHNTIGGLYIMRRTLEWMRIHRPEYLK